MNTIELQTAEAVSQIINNAERLDEISIDRTQHKNKSKFTLSTSLDVLDLSNITSENLDKLVLMFGETKSVIKRLIKTKLKESSVKQQLGCVPKNQYEYVKLQLQKWNTKMTFSEVFSINVPYQFDNNYISYEDFKKLAVSEQQLIEIRDPHRNLNKIQIFDKLVEQSVNLELPYKSVEIGNALNTWVNSKRNECKAEIIYNITFNPLLSKSGTDQLWNRIGNTITNENTELAILVIKHFIWQVKRKIHSKPVKTHLMPVLFGAQGAGKTEFISRLCAPLTDFKANTSFSEVSDERNITLWDNSILVFDEMMNAAKEDINTLKNCITAAEHTRRIMATNTTVKVINRATFIGSTNKQLVNIMRDTTGMRRFYQINTVDKMNFNVLNEFTDKQLFLTLWQSIDENSESELLGNAVMMANLANHQKTLTSVSTVESFFDDYIDDLRANNITSKKTTPTEMFSDFKIWLQNSNTGSTQNIPIKSFAMEIGHIAPNKPLIKYNKRRTTASMIITIDLI